MSQQVKLLNSLAKWSIGIGCGIAMVKASIFDVDGGERAVIFDRFRGVLPKTVGEGTHFRIPLIQYPYIYDIRQTPREISTETGTKDLQTVGISLRVLTHPDTENLPLIHREVGPDYRDRILPSLGNEIMKAVVAQYNAEQLLTEREKVSQRISELLEERTAKYHILLDDVSITHLAFGQDFNNAIEQKQVALQRAEKAKFIVARAEQEKIASIIQAEGEAEAATLISDALKENGSGVIEVRRIDAARDIATVLARAPNVTYLPSSQQGGNNNILLGLGSK